MALQQQELIERQTADLVRLRDQLAKAMQSNAKLSAERLQLCERLVEREREIERLETRALRVALSSAPPPAEEPEDEGDLDGGGIDYDAPSAQERYEAAYNESRAVSSRGR